MAKISPASIKYMVTAEFVAEGAIEKPDIVGALFGQTEGLLGTDMELRELQKEGKIGRIEVELESEDGKTKGEITIPSALDKTETTIVAAALETIDKIGPTDAKITIKDIDDVRGSKRDYIMQRAKELLGNVTNAGMESKELGQELKESSRVSKVTEYGEERIPAGPDIETSDEIIVVEGRADVVNLVKHGIKNVIGMDGTKLPKEIAKLGKEKSLVLFVDGDRGGKLIAKNVCENAEVKEITQAPDGKEVEELTGKEILQALRKRSSARDFLRRASFNSSSKSFDKPKKEKRKLEKHEIDEIKKFASDLKSKNVLALDSSLKVIKDLPVSKLGYVRLDDVLVLLTSNATKTVIDAAEKLGAGYLAAKTFGRVDSTKIELISI